MLAILCAVVLYIKIQELGMQHVVSASLLASSFFCTFIGVVFFVIGNADIPNFKVVDTVPPTTLKELKDAEGLKNDQFSNVVKK